ncbi:MAG TPA: phospholipase D-like domain-containing protein [Candidatus Eisenbacteria bacterium]|nr:phospholipase D-like domain-containing protein [Candidatus Eisenbacteria bacterium]
MMRVAARAICAWLMLAPGPAPGAMTVQACFTPQSRCSTHIQRAIDNAKEEILVAVYAFTNEELAGALVAARRRGVPVRVIIDREFDAVNENSQGRLLEKQGIAVRRMSGVKMNVTPKETGLMHQKFAVIDRRLVFSGSYNWTYAADKLNYENLLMFHDAAPLADEYRRVFLALWGERR